MGYTKVDNWLFDTVMHSVKPNTFKVISCVYRLTVGWHKDSAAISTSDFMKMLGTKSAGTTSAAVKTALDSGYIVNLGKSGRTNVYAICITPESGNTVSIVPECGKLSFQNVESQFSKNGNDDFPENGISHTGPLKETIKENINNNSKVDVDGDGTILTDTKKSRIIFDACSMYASELGKMVNKNTVEYRDEWVPPFKAVLKRVDWDAKKTFDLFMDIRLDYIANDMPNAWKPSTLAVKVLAKLDVQKHDIAISKQSTTTDTTAANDDWNALVHAASNNGSIRALCDKRPSVKATLDKMGQWGQQWNRIKTATDRDRPFIKNDFIKAYTTA